MNMMDAQSQVLSLAELQHGIFSALDKQSQARCARVCKTWTEFSLQPLWKELDSVLPLLQLLGDFKADRMIHRAGQTRGNTQRHKHVSPITISISSPPTAQRWKRFETYSRLVTILHITSLATYNFRPFFARETPVYVNATLIRMLSRSGDCPRLLPNLLSLHIYLNKFDGPSILPLASAFLSPLTSIDLVLNITPDLPATSWTSVETFLNDVKAQSHGLERFSLKVNPGADSNWSRNPGSDGGHSDLDKIIREFLSSQAGTLTTVKVNSTMLTVEFLELLSKFPLLRALENSGRRLYYTPRPLLVSSRSLPEGAFPRLQSLYLPSDAQSLAKSIINLSPVLRTLTKLTIGCRDYACPEVCGELFTAVSESCTFLTSLEIIACTSINIIGGKSNSTAAWLSERCQPADIARRRGCLSLKPIFALEHLSELTIMLDFVLPIDDLALREALKDRKTPFDVLQLSWTPRRFKLDPPYLTFDALSIVAQCCPRIRILSLFLHARSTFQWAPPSNTFDCLEELNFGLSTIHSSFIAKAAKNLCELFRNNVPEISASSHTGHFERCQVEPGQIKAIEENRHRWMEVVRAFNTMRGVQGGKSLRKYARSEGRIGAQNDC